ncbi:hypothetical protein G5V59_25180 [Nocardioides sp. W3-2-3]|nr:hypothetical protein [Nocardioides convexus]
MDPRARRQSLTFKDGVDPWNATEQDIADNIGGYKFTYMEYGAGPRTLDSVDAVIDYNMSFVDAGTPDKYRIFEPDAPKEFAGQARRRLVVRRRPAGREA